MHSGLYIHSVGEILTTQSASSIGSEILRLEYIQFVLFAGKLPK
jgi:hypothetical protein